MKKVFIILFVNILTAIRVIGVFFLLPIYKNYGGIAAGMFSVACYFTDFLDGIIARKYHASTFFGSFFDTIADKLFSCANLILLLTITKFAIIPILFELSIVTIQTIKYQNNINVQSSKMGKIKTWAVSLTVISLYLITDIGNISFLPDSFINFIINLNQVKLIGVMFIPLYVCEVLTLFSYLKFLGTYNPKEKVEAPKIDLELKNTNNFKDIFDNFCTVWFNNEFFEKYKDSACLKDIKRQAKLSRKDL